VRDQIQTDLSAALRAKDMLRVKVLRAALAAIANAEAVDPATAPAGATEVARRDLTEDDVRAVLVCERDELRSAADDLREHGRDDSHLQEQLRVLDTYLA
jgi:uncharacterized protein YqeY